MIRYLAFFLLLSSCSKQATEAVKTAELKPVMARTEVVADRLTPSMVQASGTVEARTRSVIAAQVMGMVKQVGVAVGQRVGAGQTLVVLDSEQVQASVAQAEAVRLEARSALAESGEAIAAARSQVELAGVTRNRLKQLFERQSISKQEMDEAEARMRQAEAGLAMAQARKQQVEARIVQTEQAVGSAKTQKGYTVLRAPFAGLVTEKMVEPGAMALPGAALLVIEATGGYRLAIAVEESQAAKVRLGMELRAMVGDREPIAVKVSEIVPSLDAATRSLTVKANLPMLPQLRSGEFVRCEWMVGERKALTVPATAVRQQGQVQMVFVVEEGKARSRMVRVGEAVGGVREVLSGLEGGERVVVGLTREIIDGIRIEEAR
jgi:RND family efflux transporter MFP subunit